MLVYTSSAASWAVGSGESLVTGASDDAALGGAASGGAVMSVPVYVGLGEGDVELEALGGVFTGVNLGFTVESAHGSVFGVWYQDPHAHPASRQGLVHGVHQRASIQPCAHQHGPWVRDSEPPPAFLRDEVCLVEAEHALLRRALCAILREGLP